MLTVANGSVLDNLQWVARGTVSDVMDYIKSILISLMTYSDKFTRVESCLNVLMDSDPIFKMDDDNWNMNEILSVIEMCSIFKSDYITFLNCSDPTKSNKKEILYTTLWFLTQISKYYEGFNKECVKEVHSITLSIIQMIEKKQDLKKRIAERKAKKEMIEV